jgi:hypothetical protein
LAPFNPSNALKIQVVFGVRKPSFRR